MREASTTIVTQLVELVTSLERENSDTAAGLHELIDNGVHHVTGSQYAGITLAEKSKSVNSVAATHRYPMVLDAIQNKYGEGPCLAAAWEHHVMHIADLAAEQRWQRYRRHALEQDPDPLHPVVRAVRRPHQHGRPQLLRRPAARVHRGVGRARHRLRHPHRPGLVDDAPPGPVPQRPGLPRHHRAGQGRFDLDAVEAFELLTRLSQQSNTRVVDIAAALIDSEHPLKQRRR
ncbi:GAF and ANTAR domain-containing protein [Mycobacterium avium subsp. hominissuis]